MVIIKGMNHILKDAPTDLEGNLETYKNPKLPLNGEMMKEIVDFIDGIG